MSRRRSSLPLLLALLLPVLPGCVMFERAPAELACDPALVGRWLPLPGADTEKMPLGAGDYAEIDAQCQVSLVEHGNAPRSRFRALSFELDGQRYLALDQDDMRDLFNDGKRAESKSKLPATSVLLLKYRIADEVLEVALPKASRALELVQQGDRGVREADTMVYLVEGDAGTLRRRLSEDPGLFDPFDPASRNPRLRRAGTEATP
nr:hypothetical protein [Pseudoxanthomonas sp.]